MKKIQEADKNFKINTKIEEKDIVFYDVKEEPFDLYGLMRDENDGKFIRIPKELAEKTNDGVALLYANTAGGRVRFKTDSPYVAISVKYPQFMIFSNSPVSGIAGFDMFVYENGSYSFVSDRNLFRKFLQFGEKSIPLNQFIILKIQKCVILQLTFRYIMMLPSFISV